MRYVIVRDDDVCALTPPAWIERLYRPFLERGLPVNLAVIPAVRTDVRTPDGRLEGFLAAGTAPSGPFAPLAAAAGLLSYLRAEPGYRLVQHGCHHDYLEFAGSDRAELGRRLDCGADALRDAGWPRPPAFVAPYDQLSRAAFLEAATRFPVISTGWFELGRVPPRWWAAYALKRLGGARHWRAGRTRLLSHPGCLLSFHRPCADIPASIRRAVQGGRLTVLVTHWWEYFRLGLPDEALIGALHETAAWLSAQSDVRVVSFAEVARGEVPLR